MHNLEKDPSPQGKKEKEFVVKEKIVVKEKRG